MKRYILITGVSTGIGHAIADYFIHRGYGVLGSVRKADQAVLLQQKWQDSFTPLLFDVTNEKEVQAAIPIVEQQLNGEPLLGIINNAGIAVAGPLVHLDMQEFKKQFDVNVFGVMHTTQAFWPFLIANKKEKTGKIINMSSVSGIITTPFLGAYCGSKYALEALTDGLRRELAMHHIDVLAIQPGPIQTPIWEKTAKQQDITKYQGTGYENALKKLEVSVHQAEQTALPVERVAQIAYEMLTTNYSSTRKVISRNKWTTIIASWLPIRWLDKIMYKQLFN